VSAVTPANASVSRAWNVRGMTRRPGRSLRRSEPDPAAGVASALGEGVAGSPHGQHELGLRGVVLDLVPEMADVHVDRLLVLVECLVVAEQLQELAPRDGPAGSRDGGGSRTRWR
jgi:hypothetical protein